MDDHAIDPVLLKAEVKVGNINFYVKDGIIYCRDNKTGDTVKVGEVK